MNLRDSLALLAGALRASAAPRPETGRCRCGGPMPVPAFDERDLNEPAEVVRRRWPRLDWQCPRCGARVIAYASAGHFIAGDW